MSIYLIPILAALLAPRNLLAPSVFLALLFALALEDLLRRR